MSEKNGNRPLMSDEELTALEAEFMERYKGSEQHPIRTLLRFYKGQYHLLVFAAVCYIIKKSPQWMIPIITANLINLVVEQPEHMVRSIILNAVVLAVLLLAIYGKNPFLLIAGIVLGIGHIGIHLMHRKELAGEKKPAR
jgi:hypothetical protein